MFKFDYYEKEVDVLIPKKMKRFVDGFHGIQVQCGTTPCVFEMMTYQYTNSTEADHKHTPIKISESPKPSENQGMELVNVCIYLLFSV